MKNAVRLAVIVVAALAALPGVFGAEAVAIDSNDDGKPDQWCQLEGNRLVAMRSDRDGDGNVDYAARYNAREETEYEEYDYNYDGKMDDFYFYLRGVLVRQEVDTNFDGKIDLWVYLHKGIYVERYEQDTDFNGSKDRVVDYSKR